MCGRPVLVMGLLLGALAAAVSGPTPVCRAESAACHRAIACDFAVVDGLLERSFVAPEDSIPVYCSLAERLLLSTRHEHGEEAAWLSRLALANGQLAEYGANSEKVARVRRMDELCRAALVADSTDVMAHLLLGVLNYRLCKLSCIERLLARAFAGRLPTASLEDSEWYLRRAIRLQDGTVYNHYVLALTLEEMKRFREAIEVMRVATSREPVTTLDHEFLGEATAHLAELEDRLFTLENHWLQVDEL